MSAKMNSPPSRTEEGEHEKPFIVTATVGMTSSSSSNRNNDNKIELIARTSTPTFVLKMLLCKEAQLNESDYDVRYKGKILPTSDPNTTLKECGITGSCTGISLWENDACRRRKVADELDAIRREKREQFYEKEADARAEARREIERIKAKNSYSPENTTNNNDGFSGQATMERQDTSRYGYGTSSSSQRQPFPPAEENPYRQHPQHQQHQRESSPIVLDGSSDDDARNSNYTNSAERRNQHHQNDYQNDSRRRAPPPPPPPPPEMDDLAKRRGASDELQKIIADVDAIKFRVDDILDVHKNDPSLISDDLRKTTLKNAREAAHLLEKSLLRADAVESYGFTDIRAMRKGLVARVENLCGKLEPLTKE